MKNLSNCKPTEFLRQSNRIKKVAEKWLTATDILNIRKNLPELTVPDLDADVETRAKIMAENKIKRDNQIMENASKILDAILEDHPDETLELLALLCFIEPEDADNHPVGEYLEAITEMLSDRAVIGFFTSLARLGQMSTSDA